MVHSIRALTVLGSRRPPFALCPLALCWLAQLTLLLGSHSLSPISKQQQQQQLLLPPQSHTQLSPHSAARCLRRSVTAYASVAAAAALPAMLNVDVEC